MASGSTRARLVIVLSILVSLLTLAVLLAPKGCALFEARVTRDIDAGPLVARDAAGEAVLATLLTDHESGLRLIVRDGSRYVMNTQTWALQPEPSNTCAPSA